MIVRKCAPDEPDGLVNQTFWHGYAVASVRPPRWARPRSLRLFCVALCANDMCPPPALSAPWRVWAGVGVDA